MPNIFSQHELEALLKASRAVLKYREFSEASRVIFDACCGIIGAKSGYVALLSEDGEENELLFLEAGGLPCDVNPELPMPVRGLRAESYKSGKVVYDNDFMNSRWVDFMPTGHVVLNNVLFAPLNVEEKTVGIMGIANKPGGFTERDSYLATAFGDLAAVALDNSRMLGNLKKALKEVKTLKGFIPICSHCRKVRNDDGFWEQVENYIRMHSEAEFSHGICPDCLKDHYPEYADEVDKKQNKVDND